jgi:hypothetical protein
MFHYLFSSPYYSSGTSYAIVVTTMPLVAELVSDISLCVPRTVCCKIVSILDELTISQQNYHGKSIANPLSPLKINIAV